MKIAIMTQPLGRNYGGMMQAYALQKVLRDMGHEVVTINYNASPKSVVYNLARLGFRLLKKVTGERKLPINFEKHYSYIFKDTQAFVDKHIVQSEYIDNNKDLKSHFAKNNYDAVIVGSDQVWRPKYASNIYNNYLDFLSDNEIIKRIAYAPSFGVDKWEYSKKDTRKCAKLLIKFHAISVREKSGIELCNRYLGVDSKSVLDPTLLLSKEDYLELIDDKYKKGVCEGVFTYFLDDNDQKNIAAQYIAKELNSYTYKCQALRNLNDFNGNIIHDYKMPAVDNWLASFANAKFVLTDSFHGMVFSIIFEKPFLVLVNEKRGAARFSSLLDQLGGLNHLVTDVVSIMNDEYYINKINSLSKEKLDNLKKQSMFFLISSLKY